MLKALYLLSYSFADILRTFVNHDKLAAVLEGVRSMSAQELFEIFEQLTKKRFRRHDPAYKQHLAQEQIVSLGNINYRLVLINHLHDVN